MATKFDMLESERLPPSLNAPPTRMAGGDSVWKDIFLGMTQGIEKAGMGGSPAAFKLYNDFMARGRTDPVSERDFTPRELEGLRDVVMSQVERTGKNTGSVDYPDYNRSPNYLAESQGKPFGGFSALSQNYKVHPWAIGGFQYKVDPAGNISIYDKYGFNVERGGGLAEEPGLGMMFTGGMMEGARFGREAIPKRGGQGGFPVLINIPPTAEESMRREGIPRRQYGGPVDPNQPYVVGEAGPEVIVPRQPGTVVPATFAERFSGSPVRLAGPPPTSAPPGPDIPKGWNLDPEVPKGWTLDPVKDQEITAKTKRFLGNVKPEGPVSGLISLMRTTGEALQGRRPDLLTEEGIESVIPEAVQGMIAGTGARAIPGLPITKGAREMVPYAAERYPEPYTSDAPLQLTSRLSPEEARQIDVANRLAAARTEAKRMSAEIGAVEQPSGPVATPPAQPGQTPAPSPLLPPELARQFSAVRRGVQLKEDLNPQSATNVAAREAAMSTAREAALRPHLNSIVAVGRRTTAPEMALDAALPEGVLQSALGDPAKAASLANWMRVYERAAKAKFTPQAKASLNLATKNLNNNLGTDLMLADVLKEP